MNPITAVRKSVREFRRHRRVVDERIVVRALIDAADDGDGWVTAIELSRMVRMRGRLYPILDDLEERGFVKGRYSDRGRQYRIVGSPS